MKLLTSGNKQGLHKTKSIVIEPCKLTNVKFPISASSQTLPFRILSPVIFRKSNNNLPYSFTCLSHFFYSLKLGQQYNHQVAVTNLSQINYWKLEASFQLLVVSDKMVTCVVNNIIRGVTYYFVTLTTIEALCSVCSHQGEFDFLIFTLKKNQYLFCLHLSHRGEFHVQMMTHQSDWMTHMTPIYDSRTRWCRKNFPTLLKYLKHPKK